MQHGRMTIFCRNQHTQRFVKALWLPVALFSFAPLGTARAQDVCVPLAVGVPGQPGPPAWWGGGSGPMNDPRWQGAVSYGHVNDDVQMRALRYVDGAQKYLVLSWQVNADAGTATAGGDYLYVGFWDSTTSSGNVIRVTRTAISSVSDGAFAAAFSAEVLYRDGSTAGAWQPIGALPPAPAWLQSDALLDAECIAGPPATCSRWSIRLRVPIGAASSVSNPALGLPIPDTFRMWYEVHVETAGPAIVRYKWPATAANVTDFPTLTLPDPGVADQWNPVTIGAGPCAGGVRLDSGQIFTGSGSGEITTVSPNVFHARPVNNTGAAIAGNEVRARFRIANWGSVLFDSPEWIDINPSSPSCASATGAAAPVADGGSFDLSCSWTLTPDQQCQYRPADHTCTPMPEERNDHQCILVELSSTTGVLFSRASAWRNMNFVVASTFKRDATISIRGLSDLPAATHRDTYLHVSTQNLPPPPEQREAASEQREAAPEQREAAAEERQEKSQRSKDPSPKVRPVGTKEGARFQQLLRQGEKTLADIAALMPTYLVRVYYDTGERVTKGSTTHIVLEPMPSFGYFVMHDGEIDGWGHKLDGAVEIAPNFYKLAVPQATGRAEVTTTIETIETAGPEPLCTLWCWLALGLFVLLLLIVLWLRRSS